MTAVDDIKNRLDIVDIVSETVSLRKSGRNYAGFCPFHSNTRTPAFYVFPETQTWRCFGACAEGGDLFNYVMKRENMDFKEALVVLAGKAGVQLEDYGRSPQKQSEGARRQLDLLEQAVAYYHMLFLHAPEAAPARQYVQNRGLSDETIAHFQLGFALNRWDAAKGHFQDQGYDEQELLEAGLLTEHPEKGTRYDRFRNRLMIPIRDLNGAWVGFGARTLDTDGVPKYLNSPQTAVFDKSNLLFGISEARRHIREARQVVIVEGYMDVMQAWQAGFRNVVAQMGTALTEEQLQHLKRYTKRFVLALDADAAGVKATMRSLQVARETLDRDIEVRFDARGLVLHEGRLQADIRIVTLPEGKDPDNIIRENPGAWPRLLEQARPIVQYVIDVVTADLDLADPKAKTAAAQQIVPLIKEIENSLERDHYWQALARALQSDEKALRQVLLPVKRQRPALAETQPARTGKVEGQKGGIGTAVADRRHPTRMRESYFLSQCIHYLWLLPKVNQKLTEHKQPQLTTNDFSGSEDQAILLYLQQHARDGAFAPSDDLWDSLDAALMERVEFLQQSAAAPDSELDRLADKLAMTVLDWRQEKISQLISEIKQLFHNPQHLDDDESQSMYRQVKQWQVILLNIHRVKDAMSASSRRRTRNGVGHT